MKVYNIIKIIFIIVFVILIFIGATYTFIKYEVIEKLQYETEQKEKSEYEREQIKILQKEADQNTKLQYELICQTIVENSDYYINFSKKFISVYEEFGYTKYNAGYDFFWLNNIDERLEYESNNDLLGNESKIRNEIGIRYVELVYPKYAEVFNYSHEYTVHQIYNCLIIYIPDEYMDEELINTLNKEIYGTTLEKLKDNLFVAKRGFSTTITPSNENVFVMS
jgi:hypothetical protein